VKVLNLINEAISNEIAKFHKSDDFVQSLFAVFDKKQPELWQIIGQFSDLRRETRKNILDHSQSVPEFSNILNNSGPIRMTAAM
jgi:hypothetical protein